MPTTKGLKSKLSEKLNTPLTENTETAETVTTTALTTVESNYLAFKNNALEIIEENLKNQPLSFQLFDIIKSPSGGATVFTVPGLSGDEAAKELTGIILDYSTPRAYWDTPDPIEGTPPICQSRDSITSVDGKSCADCAFNDFGSKNGGETAAKACKESVAILLLRPDNIIPVIVRVPVSSKVLFQKYMTRLVGQMISLSSVVTRISLEKATSKQGKPFALYNFEAVGTLSAEETAAAKTFAQKFADILRGAEFVEEIAETEAG